MMWKRDGFGYPQGIIEGMMIGFGGGQLHGQ